MYKFLKNNDNRPRLKLYILVLGLAWTAVIVSGLLWYVAHERKNTIDLARIQARIAFEKDVIYRRWNTMHGGVYVPVDEYTQPNPYMSNIPDRDIRTSTNRMLTLMNPDYMMRQVDELALEEFGIYGHITSLNPTREENAPDPWETMALEAFEEGKTEFSAVQIINGVEHMRLIRPLFTEAGCMQCHAKQVYQIGDVRGGLSVSVPMEILRKFEFAHLLKFSVGNLLLWIFGLICITIVGRRLLRSDSNRRIAEERLEIQHAEVLIINQELEALYKLSSTLSKTLDLEKLLSLVLKTITEIKIFGDISEGGIFIVQDDSMELISYLDHSDAFLERHKNMKIGDCLCGLAAKNGEIILSGNCHHDARHTITFPDMKPHGHIIVPLKAMDMVVGVLYLYIPEDTSIKDDTLVLLQSIGSQVGIAIENSRLYEETKALSLHDPLTGVANRRLLDIVLKRSFARAKRLKRPLSIIMLDIDNFKHFNDTYGHTEGDKILVSTAKVLLHETREIDLTVRYGGEEFLLLLPEAEAETAGVIAERIRNAVQTVTNVTLSLGVASYNLEEHEEELVTKADDALYRAKQNGKNRVEIFPCKSTN